MHDLTKNIVAFKVKKVQQLSYGRMKKVLN